MFKQLVDRLMIVPIVGVDVGSTVLKAVELSQASGGLVLRRAAIANVEGDVADALTQLLSDAGITTNRVALGLAAPEVIVKPFQFPPMPKKELSSAIQLEAEESILNGHVASQMAMDWHVLSSESREAIRGLLAVVPKTTVAARLKAAKAAGLRPVIVDVEGLALWNAYWALVGAREPAPKTVFLVNIGAKTTNLVIAKGPDELILIRDLQLGVAALEVGQGADWVTEVRDSIAYARSQGGLRALDAVYVTGGGSGPAIIPLLKSAVSAPLTFWNPLNDLERDPEASALTDAQGPLLAIAIGLALRQPT